MEHLTFDLAQMPLREVNHFLHHNVNKKGGQTISILNLDSAHTIAVGLNAPIEVNIMGHAGYYAAGMNKLASVTIEGNVGPGVAENMMSGRVHVKGFASVSAGASAHGGLLIIEDNASLRCGISGVAEFGYEIGAVCSKLRFDSYCFSATLDFICTLIP